MREKKAKLSFEVQYRYLQMKLQAKSFEKLKKNVCARAHKTILELRLAQYQDQEQRSRWMKAAVWHSECR